MYNVGDVSRISAAFKNASAVLADPTTVVFTVASPEGVVTTPAVVHDSTGLYHADVSLNKSGKWYYRVTGTGAIQAANKGSLSVEHPDF